MVVQQSTLLSVLGPPSPTPTPTRRRSIEASLLQRFANQDADQRGPTDHKSTLIRSISAGFRARSAESPPTFMEETAASRREAHKSLLPHPSAATHRHSPTPSLRLSISTPSIGNTARASVTTLPMNEISSKTRLYEQPPLNEQATSSMTHLEEHNFVADSPPPLRIAKPSGDRPPLPLRVVEDYDEPLRAAIMRNASYLYPQYEVAELSIATGMTPHDAFTEPKAFAIIFVAEPKRPGPVGKPKRLVKELLKSPMSCPSRRRALEGLLMESEMAVGAKMVGSVSAKETSGVVANGVAVGLGIKSVRASASSSSMGRVAGGGGGVQRKDSKMAGEAETAALTHDGLWLKQ